MTPNRRHPSALLLLAPLLTACSSGTGSDEPANAWTVGSTGDGGPDAMITPDAQPADDATITPGCGDGVCDPTEDCRSCATDCAPCPVCTAPSCTGANVPPSAPAARPSWDLRLSPIGGAALERLLDERLRQNPLAAAVLSSWVTGIPLRDEPRGLRDIGAALRRDERALAALRRHVEPRLGSFRRVAEAAALTPPEVHPRMSPGGSLACGNPLLRIRLARLDVIEEDDDFLNDKVYCLIHAEGGAESEIRLTTPTPPLDEGKSQSYSLADGTVWGTTGPKDPVGGLLLTYDCFEQDAADAWSKLLDTLSSGLTELAPGTGAGAVYVAAAGAAASVIGQAIKLDGDDHLFNAQQSLDPSEYLDAMSGVTWTVRRSGKHINSLWDWALQMQLWGCAEFSP